jgi:Relaxase/Mobilisation nuclease domain
MIGTISKGSDFKGLLDYLLNEAKQPEIIESQMLGKTASELAKEFNDVAAKRENVELTVRHISLSFAPDDLVDDADRKRIVDRVMTEMGYADCQYIAIAHHRDDPGHDLIHDHEHLHIVANAVSVFGERVSDSWDRLKIQPILRAIEHDFGLTPVVSSVDKWAQKTVEQQVKPGQTGRELALTIDRASAPIKGDLAAEQQPDLQMWLDRLQQENIDVRFTLKKDGTVRGIAYLQGGKAFRGSEIGRTWKSVGGNIAIGPDDVQVMAGANIQSQGHRMNLSAIERERFEQAAMMSATALDGREKLKTGRIHLKREDKTISAYRMRPHKLILKAVETAQGWEAIVQPKIDDKDLELLSKVSGIARDEPIQTASIENNVEQRYCPNRLDLHHWYDRSDNRDVEKQLSEVGRRLKVAYMAEDFMQGQPEPATLPDDYRSLDVTISIEMKESLDRLVQKAKLDRGYSLGR